MALRKIMGPNTFKDLYGSLKDSTLIMWCNELDGFLAWGQWRRNPAEPFPQNYGMGVLQFDGTFCPRVGLPLGDLPLDGHTIYYDLKRRQLAYWNEEGTNDWFDMGIDWFTLQAPYSPVTIPRVLATDGVHIVNTLCRMFLPDRMIFLGYKAESVFFTGVYETKIFSLAYGATTAPVVEHVIQTEEVFGSGVWEEWRPVNDFTCRFIQSATPERTVYLLRYHGGESKVLEYDYISKKVVGWVRRLGNQPELNSQPNIVGFSVKHKVWAVVDGIMIEGTGRHRLSLFADEAIPFNLSNPIALSPTRAGEAVKYQVRLTGEDGEPCIGHRVSWTCSALGTVVTPQSLTDSNGYAETTVAYPPRFEGPWEGTTISAEVIF